jgi:hypothetical protein
VLDILNICSASWGGRERAGEEKVIFVVVLAVAGFLEGV